MPDLPVVYPVNLLRIVEQAAALERVAAADGDLDPRSDLDAPRWNSHSRHDGSFMSTADARMMTTGHHPNMIVDDVGP